MASTSAQACMSEFTAALLNRDMGAALALLSDDAVLFYSNGSVLRKSDFSTVMTSAWKVVEDYRYSTAHLHWAVETASAAVAIYGFEWSGVARGQPVSGSGRATRVFVKGDGGWVLAHEHLSTGQAPT